MTITVQEAIAITGVDILDFLDREATIPVSISLQRQGDIILIPAKPGVDVGTEIPSDGHPVVRGENGGNTHMLVGDGPVMWRGTGGDSLELGTVTVPPGSTGFLAHPEHGYLGIGEGTYRIRRQREQADEIRMVAD